MYKNNRSTFYSSSFLGGSTSVDILLNNFKATVKYKYRDNGKSSSLYKFNKVIRGFVNYLNYPLLDLEILPKIPSSFSFSTYI